MHKDGRKIKKDSAKHIEEGSNCGEDDVLLVFNSCTNAVVFRRTSHYSRSYFIGTVEAMQPLEVRFWLWPEPNVCLAWHFLYLLPLPVRMGWKEALRSGSPSTFSLYDPILLIQVIHPSCIDRRDDRILINPCATKMLPGPITNRYTTVLWAHKRSRLNLSYRSNNRRLLLSTSDLPVERRWSLCPLSSRSIIRLICIL